MSKVKVFFTILIIISLTISSFACQLSDTRIVAVKAKKNPKKIDLFPEYLEYAKSIAILKSHLFTSRAKIEQGSKKTSINEYYLVSESYFVLIEEALLKKHRNFAYKLESTLEKIQSRKEKRVATINEALRLLDDANGLLVPKKISNSLFFQAKVISSLLVSANEEYREAILLNGKVIDEAEYQDAYGLYLEAKRLYKSVRKKIRSDEKGEIDYDFKRLNKAFLSVKVPVKPVLPRKVYLYISGLIHNLEDVVGRKLSY